MKEILFTNYELAASCVFPLETDKKLRTSFYLVKYVTNINEILITGTNPFTNTAQNLSLAESIFTIIPYRNKVVSGYYTSDGIYLFCHFLLYTGDIVDEKISLPQS